ncbi:MAG TPA: preprotein translocase subunit YajC [Longimicrobiales bacterium]
MQSALFMMLQATRTGRPSMLPFLIQLVAIIFIFYFLLIRPQRKLAQKHQQVLANLQRNDEVVTEGGIVGTVIHMEDDRVTLRTGENTRIVVMRAKIARVLSGEGAAQSK